MSVELLTSYYGNYWDALINTPLWKLPVAVIDVPVRAVVQTVADWTYEPPPPSTPQGRMQPAAPRSVAELTSGQWSPEDAEEFAQRETVQEIIRQNTARESGLYVSNPPPPSPDDDSHTLEWILGAVAVTGIAIAVIRR